MTAQRRTQHRPRHLRPGPPVRPTSRPAPADAAAQATRSDAPTAAAGHADQAAPAEQAEQAAPTVQATVTLPETTGPQAQVPAEPGPPRESADPAGSEDGAGEESTTAGGASAESAAAPEKGGTRSRLLRATAVMASGSLVSRVLGFVRNYLFGMIFVGWGSSVGSAFSAANVLPNTIWIMIGGGTLNAILVPAIVRAARLPDRGSDFTSRLFTLVTLASTALTLVAMLLVPVLLLVTNGSLPPQTYALASTLAYWMMPQILFSAVYVLLGQLLNAHDSFGPYQWAPVLNNAVAIIGSGIFLLVWSAQGDPTAWTLPMIIALAVINVGGSAGQIVFLWFYVRKLGLKLRPRWGFRGLGLGKLSRIGLWSLGMLVVGQLALYAGRWSVGGAVEEAENTQGTSAAALYPGLGTMDIAYMVFMIPQGVLAVALVTAAFPSISRNAAAGEHSRALHRYQETNRVLAVPMMLCAAVLVALAGPVMWVIDGGASVAGAQHGGWVLAAYMVGLVPFSANYLTKRAFYAYEDARSPFMMQIPTSALPLLGVVPVLLLVDPHWAAMAAALVVSIGNVAGWAFGQWMLRRHARALGAQMTGARTTTLVLARLLLAAVIAYLVGSGGVVLLGDAMWTNRVLTVLLGGVIGVVMAVVFAAVAWALKVEELRSLVTMVRARIPVGRR
jgi:putative peptidoglycan lipid II flippase